MARDDHAAERMGAHLAEPEKDLRIEACLGRGKGARTESCAVCISNQFHSFRTYADVHGRAKPWIAVLSARAAGVDG